MTDPPQECPTRTTSPSARSIALLVAVTSSARDVVGFCTEITLYPWSTSGLMTLLQEEPSAQSPWTKTIVGFVFMEAPVCANAFEPSDKTPASNRMPIFFIHASSAKKVASTNTAASSLAAQRSEEVLYAGAACVKLQVDCLGVCVKIELDHGPINAPSCPLWGKSRHVRRKKECP